MVDGAPSGRSARAPQLILGGTYEQAHQWARANGIKQPRIVTHERDLYGWPIGTRLLFVGTYHERNDWFRLKQVAQAHRLILETEP